MCVCMRYMYISWIIHKLSPSRFLTNKQTNKQTIKQSESIHSFSQSIINQITCTCCCCYLTSLDTILYWDIYISIYIYRTYQLQLQFYHNNTQNSVIKKKYTENFYCQLFSFSFVLSKKIVIVFFYVSFFLAFYEILICVFSWLPFDFVNCVCVCVFSIIIFI